MVPVIAREDCKLIGVPRTLLEEMGVFTELQRTPVQSADGKARIKELKYPFYGMVMGLSKSGCK
jgi:hypothetical protein